jgi:ComF family protein
VEYDEPVRRVVAAWKEHGLRQLGDWAAGVVLEAVARPEAACVTPVPADPDRRLKRGHHAAERLARVLGEAWGLPVEPLLRRTRTSRRQRGLSRRDRRRNVAGAFSLAAQVPGGVALIDDVYTTGATASAAASMLRKGGARRIVVVTFARTIRFR